MTAPITLGFLLYRHEASGLAHAARQLDAFLHAYHANDPGVAHEFLVIFNGFAASEGEALTSRLDEVDHRGVRFPEDQQDVVAYVRAAEQATTPVVAFLNSHSRPLAAGWLAGLHAAASALDVGIAGATASYESFYDAARGRQPLMPAQRVRHFLWRTTRRRDYRRALSEFPPFPNPHVRTNGFAIRRDLLAALEFGRLEDKIDAHALEAGLRSLSRQVAERGLRTVVVGRTGRVYDVPEWPTSRTFRSGAQENLLLADNRTEQYRLADAQERRRLATLAWGEGAV
jgi:hypothetical protein